MPTQYDRPEDPPSIDATMNITIHEPWSDPMIHRAFPGGIEDLREYVLELQGLKDDWVRNLNDPEDTRWEYTYHWRLHDYGSWKELAGGKRRVAGPFRVNQIEAVVAKLVSSPGTRQAQMITWMPDLDLECYDPPCLQSLHYRLLEDDSCLYLNCNVRFRSNDAWGASFMNMFGFIHFNHSMVADPVGEKLGREVRLGRLNWHADSYHIYGKDLDDFTARFFNRLDTPFENRVYRFNDPMIQEIYQEADRKIEEKIRRYRESHPT
jgi:thymidylate synthase